MKSFAFLLVATTLRVMFIPATDGLTCYSCAWNNSTCNTEKIGSDVPKETCSEATISGAGAAAGGPADAAAPAGDAAAATTVAPAARRGKRFITEPTGILYRSVRSKPFLSKMSDDNTYHCYAVQVKANDKVTVGRGCKKTANTDDCLKLEASQGTVEECTTCTEDNCNGGFSLNSNALLIHFSLLLAIGIAKMFFQTK